MPIHSMQVVRKLNGEDLYWFKKRQTWFDPQRLQSLLDGHIAGGIESLDDPTNGIQRVFIEISRKRTETIFFSVIINLQSLALGQRSIDLFTGTRPSIDDLQQRFSQELQHLTPHWCFPELMQWSVRQVHYAMDIKTPYLSEYGKLFKRAPIPAGFSSTYVSSDMFDICSQSQCVTFMIYDKAFALHGVQPYSGRAKQMRKAQDHLRIIVRCAGDLLYRIRRTFSPNTHKLSADVFLDQNTANAVLQDFYRQIIGYADFQSLPQALSMVREGPGRKDRKDQLSDFLRLLKQSSNVGKALKAFLAGEKLKQTGEIAHGSQRAMEYYMNEYLPELNIHPVLLPTNMKRRSLPNPMPVADRLPQE